jgi:flagellar hook-basal body complex protein FliE
MAIGPVEGSPIPLFQAHQPFAAEVAPAAAVEQDAVSAAGDGFLNLLAAANSRAQSAAQMTRAIAAGQSDDIHGTMIEVTKAGIETKLMVNVKDKVMEAFYEIWRMSV